jgi:hypothetical protein
MKSHLIVLLCLLAVVCPAQPPQSPSSHITTEYLKDSKETRVSTNMLYVVNTPEQFLQLQLSAWYPKQQLVQPAKRISLDIFSYSRAPLYLREADWQVAVVADGETLELGRLAHTALRGEMQNGKETFYAGKQAVVGMQVPLPQRAQLRTTTPIGEMTMEWLQLMIKPEQFARLAQAQQVELRFGSTRVVLNDVHKSIIREFTAAVTPVGASLADATPPAAAPSEFANSSLPDVLSYLKKEMGRNGASNVHGLFEPIAFSSCQIRYQVSPLITPAPPPGLGAIPNDPSYRYIPPTDEFYVNLADLSPDSVKVDADEKSAYISFETLNGQKKIRHARKDNSTGRVITSYNDVMEAYGSFSLRATKTAPQIGRALVQAIKLCQAQR